MLLVDDEPHLGLIIGRLGRRLGLTTLCASDVLSAWSILQRHSAELVLLDVNLPGASGLELLRRLRGTPERANQGVALFCQSGQMDDIAAGWRAGADYLLPKDLVAHPDRCQQRLEEILAHARSQAVPRSLTCPATASGQTTCDWATVLDRMLLSREARSLGEEVPEVVLRRALDRAFATLFGEEERGRWVVAGQGRLERRALPRRVPREALRLCFASLVDQWRCLLGDEASRPLVEALQVVLDRL